MINAISTGTDSTTANTAVQAKEMGKDEFLQLMVTQLRNQDPLEPMEDTEFISQLAQYSSLEQLVNMNDNMTQAMNLDYVTSQSIANSMATSLLGKQVTADSDMIYLGESGETDVSYQLNGTARDVKITIYDENGTLVDVIYESNCDSGINTLTWDGKNDLGDKMPQGHYSISVEATDATGQKVEVNPILVGTVERVQYLEGAAYLIVDGTTVTLGDVAEIGVEN